MLNKPIGEVSLVDIEALITAGVSEGRTIEYKLALPGGTDGEMKEFLADVSSFANTAGGDLVFGVSEDNGLPMAIVGLTVPDEDATKLRLENVIRDGLEPRIQADLRFFGSTDGPRVLVVRVKRSWLQPHRVVYRGHDKFYARNSAGKASMDTTELRVAFTTADRISGQIGDFVRGRLAELGANVTPVPFRPGPKVVLHLVPLEAFSPGTSVSVLGLGPDARVQPIYSRGWDDRINLDGLLVFSPGPNGVSHSYTQFYRNGIIEAVSGSLVRDGMDRIPSVTFELELLRGLDRLLRLIRDLGIAPPVNIRLALLGVRGFQMGVDAMMSGIDSTRVIDRDELILPDTVIEDLAAQPQHIMRPLFNLVWNACGYASSPYFDAAGNWTSRPR